jgi:iron complex transport system ATP-binding protein
MSVITLDKIGFRYNSHRVLQDISFSIRKGEFLGIIGPNGSGKTTLLKVIDGILKPEEGEIRINGISGNKLKRNSLAKIIAVVAQDFQMIFPFSVHEIVLMGRAPHLNKWRFEGETDFRIARETMEMTDTMHLMNRSMSALSGGERQRVLIARALAQQPQIMLLDEPTSFLDIKHQVDFFDLIKKLNKNSDLTVVAITHDINLAALYCDRIIMLRNGHIHCEGNPEEVITEKNIKEVYETDVAVDKSPATGRPRITLLSSHPSKEGSRF